MYQVISRKFYLLNFILHFFTTDTSSMVSADPKDIEDLKKLDSPSRRRRRMFVNPFILFYRSPIVNNKSKKNFVEIQSSIIRITSLLKFFCFFVFFCLVFCFVLFCYCFFYSSPVITVWLPIPDVAW